MLCFFIALFFAVGSAFGFTESSDFVFSHSITNPISNNPNTQFGYGIAIGQSGLEMYAADFASAKLYYFIRSAHSASFVQSYALPIPVYGTSYPITADDELTVMVYVSNKTLVIYNLAEGGAQEIALVGELPATSAAVSGDGQWIVVGRPSRNAGVGEFEVYRKGAVSWSSYQSGIQISSIPGNTGFGTSVAISGDGTTVAAVHDSVTPDQRVWIFKRSGVSLFTQFQTLEYASPTDYMHGRNMNFQVPSMDFTFDGNMFVYGAPLESGSGILCLWKFQPASNIYQYAQEFFPETLNPVSTTPGSSRSVQISPDGEVICTQAFNGIAVYGKAYLGIFDQGMLFSDQQLQPISGMNPAIACSGSTIALADSSPTQSIRVLSRTVTQVPTPPTNQTAAPSRSSSTKPHSTTSSFLSILFTLAALLVF